MRLIKKISKVGNNSLMIIIPKVVVDTFKLEVGDEIVFDVVRRIKRKKDDAE